MPVLLAEESLRGLLDALRVVWHGDVSLMFCQGLLWEGHCGSLLRLQAASLEEAAHSKVTIHYIVRFLSFSVTVNRHRMVVIFAMIVLIS